MSANWWNEPENDETEDNPRHYTAWKGGSNKGERRLRLFLADGTTATIGYAGLVDTFCDDSTLTLVFAQKIILLTGEKLGQIEELMMDHKIRHLYCFQQERHPLRNADEPVITSILFQSPNGEHAIE